MQVVLIEQRQPSCQEDFCSQFVYALKIALLVIGTYGLMVGDFALCLVIEFDVSKPISQSYIYGGAILLGLFVIEVTCWGIAWCWGARKREGLRRMIVERQLAQIRAMEQAEEEKDLEEEKRMIEARRMQLKK